MVYVRQKTLYLNLEFPKPRVYFFIEFIDFYEVFPDLLHYLSLNIDLLCVVLLGILSALYILANKLNTEMSIKQPALTCLSFQWTLGIKCSRKSSYMINSLLPIDSSERLFPVQWFFIPLKILWKFELKSELMNPWLEHSLFSHINLLGSLVMNG